jgi:amino acid adenylation domain-containing protein
VLAGIWGEVLGRERVGVEAGFFDLGGHSLLATQVVSRARQALGVEVPLRALFEAPTVAGLAGRIDALRAEGGAPAPPIVRVPREGVLPVSFAQQRLWFIDQLEPGSAAYNVPSALRLRGRFDPGVLERAVTEIVRRHETLRTVFAMVDGEPVQVVRDTIPLALPVTDLRSLPAESREAVAARLASEEAVRPFDLAAGPLLRVSAMRLDETEWGLLITMHHVVSDGWSIGVLVREVSALYDALAAGREAELPELPVQYADYATWQRRWLVGETLEARLGYWREKLAGAPSLLELPTDRLRPKVQGPRGSSVGVYLASDVSAGLRAYSRREGTTLFMTLLTAWQLLLSRYAGQEDVSVGTPIAGRTRLETEPLIGFFVNTLVLRTDLSGEPTFGELLGRVRETTLGAYQHQEIPFERLVEELAPERSLAHSPLFQAMFVLQNNERGELRMGELEVEPLAADGEEIAKFDLKLGLAEDDQGLSGLLSYRAELWDRATLERMVGHLEVLLEAMVADPARRVTEVPLLRGTERTRLLESCNATRAEFPAATIHELFVRQAARTPRAVAVVFGAETLTYAELERQAGRLAHHLRALGSGPDARVGILLERSAETVVTVLAILMSGAAYVPLDPSYPDARLHFMLEDSGASLAVSNTVLAGRIAGFRGRVVTLDGEADAISATPPTAPVVSVSPRNLAYVIYTSGSTGTPKGVLLEHRGLSNYLGWFDRTVLGEEGFALPLVSRLSFDAHVRQLFPPLLRGEAVWVLPEETVTDPEALLDALSGHERVFFGGVPSLWSAMLERVRSGESARTAGLKAVLLGGEALTAELAERTFEVFPDVALWNHYGPTEATVNTTVARVRRGEPVGIGRPVANARVYLLDAYGVPVPVGVPGELYVGGVGVSRGYLGHPERTAEKYLPDPFSVESGARMYRSGDRVRWRADGELEYAGRVDHQVKVRGFRIELGEIETVLTGHAAVREAVVAAREDTAGQERLVAYVVAHEGEELSAVELRTHLVERLPEYMVPSAVVVLEGLPLSSNGKVDRRALPAPEMPSEGYTAPRTPTEEVLAEIYADVLRAELVGSGDNFFDLGGHSLLATRVVSRVRRALGVELPLRVLFEAPTVAGLAGRVEALLAGGEGTQAPLVALPRDGSALPLSFAQQRLWFMDQLEPGSATYNMPYALRLRGCLDPAALERSLTAIMRRHETLRTVFATAHGEPVQVIRDPAPAALPVADLRSLPAGSREVEVIRLASEEAARPFDLARGPLLRSTLLRIADDDHVLCFTMHHIISDGWSRGVLVREVSALYGAFSRGEAPSLPELPVQYADYAVWQRSRFSGEVLEAQVGYWKEKLGGAPPLLEVPTDRPRAPGRSPLAATHPFALTPELSRGLRALSQAEGTTLFMTVLAAWQALLGRWAVQEDVVVGTPIAGRTRQETEGLIGFFVNMLAMRADLSGDLSWTELLGRMRETALGAYAHQELPFDRLVEELAVERSLTHSPLFQSTFALEPARGENERLELGALAVEPFGARESVTKFDLDLAFADAGEALVGALVYREALFEAETIARMAGHLEVVLETMSADPGRRLSELSLLRGAERAQVLEAGNATAWPVPAGCVHERFAEQAARTPEKVALVHDGEALSYAELAARVDGLALRLRVVGVRPELPVGICVERSPEMIVAVLATLAAGGAYVPVDPAYPAERVDYLLADSGVRVVLTQAALSGRFVGFHGDVVLVGGSEARPEVPEDARAAPAHTASLRNLAYVIYTSGSTGSPKGVGVEHASLANYAYAAAGFFGITPADRVLQFASLSFDTSAEEIYPTLLGGATLVLRTDEMLGSAARFLERCAGWGVTVLDLPTAYWHELVGALQRGEASLPECVRLVVVGGEQMQVERVEQWRRSAGKAVVLVNGYGPTEATVVATQGEVGEGTLSIGGPVKNVCVYVLDGQGAPVPVGVPGELWIGGAGVARGYLGRADATAERFGPDPYSGKAGARMYRSGDRVRWLGRGELEYLGRLDAQVKVRGFRIEPGEIEAELRGHHAVREAVVVAWDDAAGERRLVGYVTEQPGQRVSAAEVRGRLKERLPRYMVPAAVVVLETIPLTPSGKVDRRALPAPEWGGGEEGAYVAPRTPTEELLAGIWAEVLGRERVGVEDNFFEQGGHSLLATRVVSRVRAALGVELPVRVVFEAPTVEGLARFLSEQQPSARLDRADEPMIRAASDPQSLLEALDELSDDELDRLLAFES